MLWLLELSQTAKTESRPGKWGALGVRITRGSLLSKMWDDTVCHEAQKKPWTCLGIVLYLINQCENYLVPNVFEERLPQYCIIIYFFFTWIIPQRQPSMRVIIHVPGAPWQFWKCWRRIWGDRSFIPEHWNNTAPNPGRELSDLRCMSRKHICYEPSCVSLWKLLETKERERKIVSKNSQELPNLERSAWKTEETIKEETDASHVRVERGGETQRRSE